MYIEENDYERTRDLLNEVLGEGIWSSRIPFDSMHVQKEMKSHKKYNLVSLPIHVAALGMLVMTLSSCVVTYRAFPEAKTEDISLPKTTVRILYRPATAVPLTGVPPTLLRIGHYPLFPIWHCNEGQLAEELVHRGVVREAIVDSEPPPKGLYYAATIMNEPVSGPLEILAVLLDPVAILSYGILSIGPVLPYYSGHAGHLIRYDLYMDGEIKKAYRYEIAKKGVAWVGLLPFAWVNLLTDDQQDACRAALHRFIRDVERDGYLKEDSG